MKSEFILPAWWLFLSTLLFVVSLIYDYLASSIICGCACGGLIIILAVQLKAYYKLRLFEVTYFCYKNGLERKTKRIRANFEREAVDIVGGYDGNIVVQTKEIRK